MPKGRWLQHKILSSRNSGGTLPRRYLKHPNNFEKNAAGLILAAFFYVQYMKTAVG